LRYPGGKASLTNLLARIRRLNGLGARVLAEPFAGGAGASLTLLYLEEAHGICINDSDPAIYDFWWALINDPVAFSARLSGAVIEMPEWRRQRDVYRSGGRVSRLDRGFSAFYLNRCNRSGIIMNGGPIGGVEQQGKWKLGARFNKDDLSRRCAKVSEYADRICVTGLDGIDFIRSVDPVQTCFFIDPPYFGKGGTLYLNAVDGDYHADLADLLKSMSDAAWVLTYDDCPEIRHMYEGWAAIRPFALRYAAAERRDGREILITPKWMRLPSVQESSAIAW
jgi:DNA adenine methylase